MRLWLNKGLSRVEEYGQLFALIMDIPYWIKFAHVAMSMGNNGIYTSAMQVQHGG